MTSFITEPFLPSAHKKRLAHVSICYWNLISISSKRPRRPFPVDKEFLHLAINLMGLKLHSIMADIIQEFYIPHVYAEYMLDSLPCEMAYGLPVCKGAVYAAVYCCKISLTLRAFKRRAHKFPFSYRDIIFPACLCKGLEIISSYLVSQCAASQWMALSIW